MQLCFQLAAVALACSNVGSVTELLFLELGSLELLIPLHSCCFLVSTELSVPCKSSKN